jgi:hypothetical protein
MLGPQTFPGLTASDPPVGPEDFSMGFRGSEVQILSVATSKIKGIAARQALFYF